MVGLTVSNETKLRNIFYESAFAALSQCYLFDSDKAIMPGGRNGPYLDLESPLRNTAHWLVTFAIAYHLSSEPKFLQMGKKLCNFLLADNQFSFGSKAVFRQIAGKSWCNGVIGHAWIAEGLVYSGRLLNMENARWAAVDLLESIPFDYKRGLWNRIDPILGDIGADLTYNHQSWFASIAAEAGDSSDKLKTKVRRFLDVSLKVAFDVAPNGLIAHSVQGVGNIERLKYIKPRLRLKLAQKLSLTDPLSHNGHERDLGYHLFVLYSMARLRLVIPDHQLWNENRVQRALELASSDDFFSSLDDNHYAYPYNAPGLEYPMISEVFRDLTPHIDRYVQRAIETQINKTWSDDALNFTRGTYDSATLSARLYEIGIMLLYTNSSTVTSKQAQNNQ